jgi:hypothetical protein
MAGTDDEIIFFQIESLNGHWEKWKIIPVMLSAKREMLKERSLDGMRLNFRTDGIFEMKQCIDIRLWKQVTELLQAPFPSPHSRQPVMDKRNFH